MLFIFKTFITLIVISDVRVDYCFHILFSIVLVISLCGLGFCSRVNKPMAIIFVPSVFFIECDDGSKMLMLPFFFKNKRNSRLSPFHTTASISNDGIEQKINRRR